MKKIVSSILLVVLLVTGCGEKKQTTKICTIIQNGTSVDFELVPDGNSLKKMTLSMKQDLQGMPTEEEDNYRREWEKLFEADGIKVDISIADDVASIKVIFNVKELDELPPTLQNIADISEGIKNTKFDALIKEMKDAGAKCK